MIRLDLGNPGPDVLPDGISDLAHQTFLGDPSKTLLGYGEASGTEKFKSGVVTFLTRAGYEGLREEHVTASAGISHALSMFSSLLTQDTAKIIMDDPSYMLAKDIFRSHGLKIFSVPRLDDSRLNFDMYEEIMREHEIAFVYIVASFNNPTGKSVSPKDFNFLASMTQKWNVQIVADQAYELVSFAPSHHACNKAVMWNYLESNLICLGSFSKIFAPALRSGWILVRDASIRQKVLSFGELKSGGGFSAFTTHIMAEALHTGLLHTHLLRVKKILASKAKVMAEALRLHMPVRVVTFEEPEGGYFIWLRLGPICEKIGLDAREILRLSLMNAPPVLFLPGDEFSESGQFCVRLCFARACSEDIVAGIKHIARIIRKKIANYENTVFSDFSDQARLTETHERQNVPCLTSLPSHDELTKKNISEKNNEIQ